MVADDQDLPAALPGEEGADLLGRGMAAEEVVDLDGAHPVDGGALRGMLGEGEAVLEGGDVTVSGDDHAQLRPPLR
ncbi:hypothetical protein D3C72_2149890 [compost metagenome]